jgi:acyl carrier protein
VSWRRGKDGGSESTAHGDFREFSEGDSSVDDKQILEIVHQTAAEMMAAKGDEAVQHGSTVGAEGTDSLINWYGFSSIDALECLLILEQKFGITLADEDFSAEVLSSATVLARRIAALQHPARLPSGNATSCHG